MQLLRAENFILDKTDLNSRRKIILLVSRYRTNSLIMHKTGEGKILSVDYDSLPTLLKDIDVYEDELFSF